MLPGQNTAAEGPVQVIAATAAGAVHRFPYKIKSRMMFQLETVGFQLGKGNAPTCGLGVFPASVLQFGKAPVFKGAGQ